ncbi:hypothetical protein TD95_004767 [Thielaviopsis punctulata]|uniref:HCNGP-like protein n=1 Tax=Thielaviopsis punctulata TaxID=72032 RepID=A0A0F4ZGM7_9PEZI|nr:hypothetical protein TD95_004767 [Thielaviopsis punctulata]
MGLVQYDSSSDDDDVEAPAVTVKSSTEEAENAEQISEPVPAPAADYGLMMGPMMPPQDEDFSLPEPEDELQEDSQSEKDVPYEDYRLMLRELTYPTVPKLDFAPSPPGSPDPQAATKVTNMMRMKRNNVHFNLKLEESTAFQNPSITNRLLDFAAVTGDDQYATVLPTALWDPTNFPSSARISKLYELARQKPRAAGKTPTFVPPASLSKTYQAPQGPSGLMKRQKRK